MEDMKTLGLFAGHIRPSGLSENRSRDSRDLILLC